MSIDMVAAADAAQREPERFEQAAELLKVDIPRTPGGDSVPKWLSPRTGHRTAFVVIARSGK
jgi:hypothetical protein